MASSTENISGNVALVQVGVSTDGGTVFVAVAENISVGWPNVTFEEYETTNTDNTTGIKTFTVGWGDTEEITIQFNYRADTLVQLQLLSGTIDIEYVWTDPGSTTTDPELTFECVLKSVSVNMEIADRWTIDLVVKPSGAATFTEGTTV